MKNAIIYSIFTLLSIQSHAAYSPCVGRAIPYEKSRMATNIRLTCGGGGSQFSRTYEKVNPETFNQWTKLERQGRRQEMQALRLENDPEIKWQGKIAYNTYLEWDWFIHRSGENAAKCGTHTEYYECKKVKYKQVCTEDSSSSSGGSSGSSYRPPKDYSSGGTGVSGESGSAFPSARRPNGCYQVEDGYTNETCEKTVANFCHWEEKHSEREKCSDETMTYSAKFNKPRISEWGPHNPKYMDILPNKYDLLPGESESITVFSNFGISERIRPEVSIDNAWNKYTDVLSFREQRCRQNNPLHLDIEIDTEGRVMRKTPNAFAPQKNRYGKEMDVLYRDEVAVKDDVAKGKPYEVRLQDSSNQMMTIAARQSRNLNELDNSDVAQVTQNKRSGIIPLPESFWKDTQFRLRMIKKQKFGRDILVSQNIYTDAGTVMSTDDNIIIPLDGRGGVDSLFQATGPFNFALKNFWAKTSIELTPGADYELLVSTYQRGLPFYESGCKEGLSCEGDSANDRSFSDEMVIKFTADPRVDQRGWFQKFIDWQAGR